ncbi:hypothetical protein F5Y02DRAFT_414582 [Annulohypoxylon stygium]|nr:hypothetical protein F5Y02DRAFT_414582 [Annulohypoxylon stygium]
MAEVPYVSEVQLYGQSGEQGGNSNRLCIKEPRCRLCSFGLQNGDWIKISAAYHEDMPESVHHPFQFFYKKVEWDNSQGDDEGDSQSDDDHCEDDNSEDGDDSDDDASLVDSDDGTITRFAICCCCDDICVGRRATVHCFHLDCWAFIYTKFGMVELPIPFFHSTHFSYFSPAWRKLEEDRTHYFRSLLAENLKKEKWPMALPNEVWQMIAGYLVREAAIITEGEKCSSPLMPNTIVDLHYDVYAEYTMFEGKRYLKAIGNCSKENAHGRPLIHRGQDFENVREVYSLDDHRGIRDIIFITDKERQLSNASLVPSGTWLMKISGPLGVWKISVGCDGFKARSIYNTLAFSDNVSFAMEAQQIARFRCLPAAPVTIFDIRSLTYNSQGFRLGGYRVFPRMDSFDLNHPDVIGYSAALGSNHTPIAIYAHRSPSDLDMYEEMIELIPATWIYMPIDQGELVTEIGRFMTTYTFIDHPEIGLTFTTNRGRTGVFGGDSNLRLVDTTDLYRIHEPAPGPSKIYFDKGSSMNLLAFENVQPSVKRELPDSVKPVDPQAESNDGPDPYYYSRCELAGVTRITPCYRQHPHPNQFMGMLLEYEGGHTERMGEWRFDWAAESINVGKKTRLRLTMEDCAGQINGCNTSTCEMLTAEVVPRGTPLKSGSPPWYMDVPWCGTLEWWFDGSTKWCDHTSAKWRRSNTAIQRGYVDVYDSDDDEGKEKPKQNVDNWQEWVDMDELWETWFEDDPVPWYEDSDDELDPEFEDDTNPEVTSN